MSASPDVVVVGAGMAGAVSARLLARPCFKAEKIEPDQRELCLPMATEGYR